MKRDPSGQMYSAVTSRIKLLSQMNIAERRLPQDGRIKVRLQKAIDIEFPPFPHIRQSIVMRLLDKETSFITLEEIALTDASDHLRGCHLETLRHDTDYGPTGSGKSLPLCLSRKNQLTEKKIIPWGTVEYLMQGITRYSQAENRIDLCQWLRHIVRQDLCNHGWGDRDMETASIGIQCILTAPAFSTSIQWAPSNYTTDDMGSKTISLLRPDMRHGTETRQETMWALQGEAGCLCRHLKKFNSR